MGDRLRRPRDLNSEREIRIMARTERTSSSIASVAAQLLNGAKAAESIGWLEEVADNPHTTEEARGHAATLLGILASVRRVAASALTQR